MGGGRTSPARTGSSRSEDVDGGDTGSTGDNEEDGNPRFTDPSSEAQKQINAFIGNAEANVQSEAGTGSPTGAESGAESEVGSFDIDGLTTLETTSGDESSTDTDVEADTDDEKTSGTDDDGERASSEEFTVDIAPAVGEARNGGEFARAVFSEGALSDRARSEADEWGVDSAAEPGTGRYGSWEEFDEANIVRRRALVDTSDEGGVTEEYMEVAEMSGDATDSYRAYITQYGIDPASVDDPTYVPEDWQAVSQLAASGFAHACGVRAPGHTYDSDEEYVAAAGVNRFGHPEAEPIAEIGAGKASKVDRDEYLDICAVQHLAGNNDLHSGNVFIDEEGGVHCIDYDRGGWEYNDMASMEAEAFKAKYSAEKIDKRRDDDFDVDRTAITDRAQELAVALEVSGQKERVLQSVAEYDDLFPGTEKQHAEIIRHNINVAADAARRE